MSVAVEPVDTSLLTHFASLNDPRRAETIEHRLIDILAIARMCGHLRC
jgi:hypothetical protein